MPAASTRRDGARARAAARHLAHALHARARAMAAGDAFGSAIGVWRSTRRRVPWGAPL